MSAETNKAIVRRYFGQVWNERRRDLFEEFIVENVVHHLPTAPGLQGMKEGYDNGLNAFPDVRITIDDLIAEGDKVVTRWMMSGTHLGALMGIANTGKQINQSGVTIFRLANARIVEGWCLADNLSLMKQLDDVSTPETV